MKIALIADSHLSDITTVPQEASFNWALDTIGQILPDACLWLGDITACGAVEAAERFLAKTNALPFPCVIVPGNSDLRTPATAAALERKLHNHLEGLTLGDLTIVGMNTSRNTIDAEERNRLGQLSLVKNVLLCSHQPAKYLDPESLNFLTNWLHGLQKDGHRVLLWASGHRHVYGTGTFEEVPTVSLRALDLDKCIGGTPHICLWDSESGSMEEICYNRSMPQDWSEVQREEFSQLLGITCQEDSKLSVDMPFAIENGIRHVEWKALQEHELPILEKWRQNGGQTFALAMPAIGYDGGIIGLEAFQNAAENAIRANADRITLHPPLIKIKESPVAEAISNAMAETLLPVANAGIEILVENNHTASVPLRTPEDCLYGCSPKDIVHWRDTLNSLLGADRCHLSFNVGIARNNEPISDAFPVGKWYAVIGSQCRGYHLHQTAFIKTNRTMACHHPILAWSDDMISYCGFLWAWHTGLLHHSPLLLDVRYGEGVLANWQRLQQLLQK